MSGQLAIQKTLNETLVQTRLRNPAFSLRALARKLDLSPAAVSEIINGKRPVTRRVAQKVVSRLGLDPQKANQILSLFPEGPKKRTLPSPVVAPTRITMDQYHTIADWWHYAILSLAETADFKGDPEWVASRLAIKVPEAKQALDRLERLNMLRREEATGQLIATGEQYSSTDDIRSLALRKVHAQYLDMSKNVLEEVDVMLRDFIGVTMAIDLDRLPQAKKIIRQCIQDVCATLESGRKTEVYRLNVQLIPLSIKEISS